VRVTLDTHILVYWISDPHRLTPPQQHAVRTVSPDNPAIVADISLWEIAMLAAGGKIKLGYPVRTWLARAVAPPLVRLAEITPTIAGAVTDLISWPNRDPADKLIVATAQAYGAVLLTNDEVIRSAELVEVV